MSGSLGVYLIKCQMFKFLYKSLWLQVPRVDSERLSTLRTVVARTSVAMVLTMEDKYDKWQSLEMYDMFRKINSARQVLNHLYSRGHFRISPKFFPFLSGPLVPVPATRVTHTGSLSSVRSKTIERLCGFLPPLNCFAIWSRQFPGA